MDDIQVVSGRDILGVSKLVIEVEPGAPCQITGICHDFIDVRAGSCLIHLACFPVVGILYVRRIVVLAHATKIDEVVASLISSSIGRSHGARHSRHAP